MMTTARMEAEDWWKGVMKPGEQCNSREIAILGPDYKSQLPLLTSQLQCSGYGCSSN